MSQPLNIIIVEKTGTLKSLSIKDFKEDELYKKCGFKKAEDFVKQTEIEAAALYGGMTASWLEKLKKTNLCIICVKENFNPL